MKKAIGLTLAACTALLAGSVALAGADVGSWYVAPLIQGVWLDNSRAADPDLGFKASFGLVASPNWNIELGYGTSDHNQTAGQKLKLQSYELTAQRVFYRDQRVNPYFTVGLGKFESDQTSSSGGGHVGVTYGVGLLADIAKNTLAGTDLQFRSEITARRLGGSSGGDSNVVDYLAGIGLQYNWGGTKVQPKPLDSDGDGVPDSMDKCPGTPPGTVVNADGCEPVKDSDGDGVMDPNDKCPNTPAGAKVDANGCELDADGDGVVDRLDKCPNTPAGAKVDANGCELDSDGDGVVDSKDQCPDTPKGDRVDMFGCSFKKEIKLPGVVFDTNSAELRPESYPILDGAAEVLKRYPELKVEVAGHTDSDASDAYNLALSNRRAATVMQYLKDKGAANELKSHGYGKRQPIASNKTAEGKAQNRRVVLRVLN
jgi:OOP family OmpA-OmpF porin